MINGGRKDILNILDLKSLKEPYYIVNLAGLQYTGDNFGGVFLWDDKSTETPDDLNIIKLENFEVGRYERSRSDGTTLNTLDIKEIINTTDQDLGSIV